VDVCAVLTVPAANPVYSVTKTRHSAPCSPSMHLARVLARRRALQLPLRSLTTTATPIHVTSYTSSSSSVIPLSNIEAQWEKLSVDEQSSVHTQLEELQKKDWRKLSLDEKKAGSYPFLTLYPRLLMGVCSLLCCLWTPWTPHTNKSAWN
jgi:hypothetical protein